MFNETLLGKAADFWKYHFPQEYGHWESIIAHGLEIPKTFFHSFQSPSSQTVLEKYGVEDFFGQSEKKMTIIPPPAAKGKITCIIILVNSVICIISIFRDYTKHD